MAQFERIRSRYFNEGKTESARLSYLANMAKVFVAVEKAKFRLGELKLKENWAKRTNEYDQLLRKGDYRGAYEGYAKIIDEQIAHYKELQSSPNAQQDDLLRYEIKISNLQDRKDSIYNAYQKKQISSAKSLESKWKKENKRIVYEKLDTFDFRVKNYWDNWKNREKINGNEATGGYVDRRLWEMVVGKKNKDGTQEDGILEFIDRALANKDSLDQSTINKLIKKRDDIENAIAGKEESASSPLYKLKDRYLNPDNWYDVINPYNGKLKRTPIAPFTYLGNVGVDLSDYYKRFGNYTDSGEKLPRDVAGKLQVIVPNPENLLQTMTLAYDEIDKKWTIYDRKSNTSRPLSNPQDFKYRALNKQVARDSETGQLYVIENNMKRPVDPAKDGDITPEIYNTQIIDHSILQSFEEMPQLNLPEQEAVNPQGQYRKERDNKGGFNFYNPDNKPVPVEEYANALGITREEALKGSENPQDIAQPAQSPFGFLGTKEDFTAGLRKGLSFLNPNAKMSPFRFGFPKSRGFGGIF